MALLVVFDWDDFYETNHRFDLLDQLKEIRPDFRCTLFAVPGMGSEEFWASVPEWCELALHGHMHPDPYECANWDYFRMVKALATAPPVFVNGWKSPGWQISDDTYRALMDHGWWCADHPENNYRRPDGLQTHVLGTGDHWHGHIQNVCGNGLEETFETVCALVEDADSFEFVSESLTTWKAGVAA